MTFLEVFTVYILPTLSVFGGFGALIIFLLSRAQYKAATRKMHVEADEVIALTPAKLQQMITDASAAVLESQNHLIDNLQEQNVKYESRIAGLECKDEIREKERIEQDKVIKSLVKKVDVLEKEILDREGTIEKLKEKVATYQEENVQLKAENKELRQKLEDQQVEINKLKVQLSDLKKTIRGARS